MQHLLVVLAVVCGWATAAEAKTIKIPKGSIEVNQLHDELLERFPAWRGTAQPDGMFTNSPLYVESTDQEIRLTVPEDASDAAIQSVVAAHVPGRRKAQAASRAHDASNLMLEERVQQLEAALGLQE